MKYFKCLNIRVCSEPSYLWNLKTRFFVADVATWLLF